MKKSKFFRVAVAGSTTDGRVIEATWIQQMADSYDPNTYTALGNLEHYRGFSPSSEFGTYAKVTALKAEEVEINGTKNLHYLLKLMPLINCLNCTNVVKSYLRPLKSIQILPIPAKPI